MEMLPRGQNSPLLLILVCSTVLLGSKAAAFQMYNATSDMCCNGTVTAHNGSTSVCCGSTTYDPRQSKCCMDRVVPLPEDDGFRHGCCMNLDLGNITAFDFETHICCDGILLEKPDRNATYGCHEGSLFNASSSISCGDEIVNREPRSGCCGDEIFDFENETCCVNVDRSTSSKEYQIHPQLQPGQRCCGTRLYNATDEVCCDGRIQPKPEEVILGICCGDSVITNYTTQICCNGKILERPSENHTCCEDNVYDFNEEVCCGTEVLEKDASRSCCLEAGKSYDAKTEICCQTEVVAIDTGSSDAGNGNSSCCASAVPQPSSFARMRL